MSLVWLALAAIAAWALVRLGRQTEGPRRGHWRIAATIFAAVLLAAAVLAAARGAWLAAVGLGGAGFWFLISSRLRPARARSEVLTEEDARAVLGVSAGASPGEINSAWRRLMTRAHPDQGGTEGLAARLNAARDRLLRR